MKDLAPDIYRQRLVIEGLYTIEISPSTLKDFTERLSKLLEMTIIYGPIVQDLAGQINPIHKGYECILIWAESGTAVYTWSKQKFFSIDIYTCKAFDANTAIDFAKSFFEATEIVFKEV